MENVPVELYKPKGLCPCSKKQPESLAGAAWVNCNKGDHPGAAVYSKSNGENVLIARGNVDGNFVPGGFCSHHNTACIPCEGKEIQMEKYQVLVGRQGTLYWLPSSNGVKVPRAVVGGKTANGDVIFIGRANHNGNLEPGKILPKDKKCYVVCDGKIEEYEKYEILVAFKPNDSKIPPGAELAKMIVESSKSEAAYGDSLKQRKPIPLDEIRDEASIDQMIVKPPPNPTQLT